MHIVSALLLAPIIPAILGGVIASVGGGLANLYLIIFPVILIQIHLIAGFLIGLICKIVGKLSLHEVLAVYGAASLIGAFALGKELAEWYPAFAYAIMNSLTALLLWQFGIRNNKTFSERLPTSSSVVNGSGTYDE